MIASGFRNRWNDDRQFVSYTSESRSLACLENLVHHSHSGDDSLFRTMIIFVPDELSILKVQENNLPKNWREGFCSTCLEIGQTWYAENKHPILKVPTTIVPYEWNFLLNTCHPDFTKIKLVSTESFQFDSRFR
ncbi:RES domain-containing protein [Tunicatimonas pelagia]|nr:RES domain-containing protein [Tunicatimonas pelagia]WKN43981.1 RES domain-containing protein [Tunicatimonas pelagia]